MPLILPSIENSTLEYDSGLKLEMRTVVDTDSSAFFSTDYAAKTKLLIISNLGSGNFKDKIEETLPIESGETFKNPGICFSIEANGKFVRAVSPCCLRVLNTSTVAKNKIRYLACNGCKNPLIHSPVSVISTFSKGVKRPPKGYVPIEKFVEDWSVPFENVYEAILTAQDLKDGLFAYSQISEDYCNELRLFDRRTRKHKRDTIAYQKFDKKFEKYLASVKKELAVGNLYSDDLEQVLRANSKVLI